MTQSVQEQIRAVPAIETEFHLFQVGSEMLGTDSVPRSRDTALEKRESGFNCIRVNVAHDVHAGTVRDFLMSASALCLAHGSIVRGCVISENHFHIFGDILADVLGEC